MPPTPSELLATYGSPLMAHYVPQAGPVNRPITYIMKLEDGVAVYQMFETNHDDWFHAEGGGETGTWELSLNDPKYKRT